MATRTLVFVHGYSVSNFDTYGELPQRLKTEAELRNLSLSILDLYLGRYISFNDEVKLHDVAKAFQNAVKDQIPTGTPFVCITHSTGAPLVRTWLHHFYANQNTTNCPLSHLIMLAPANHGSALAQLGKSRLSRIKAWFDQVEPGQKILNWLELGSDDACELNIASIKVESAQLLAKNIFSFVLCGQDIDRKLYDHLNSYTGEAGSDGVVRVASANLNAAYLKLEQSTVQIIQGKTNSELVITTYQKANTGALRILSNRSHSGNEMGILKSVSKDPNEVKSQETINAIFQCLSINNQHDYSKLCDQFSAESEKVQTASRIEIEHKLLGKNYHFHDRYAMVIFRIRDNEGNSLSNFDLILTTGAENDPDNFPKGFLADRQKNQINQANLTYYFNYDLLIGSKELKQGNEIVRSATQGIESIGIRIQPRPDEGFVRYLPCEIKASKELMQKLIQPNSTCIVDICLFRVLSNELFRFEKTNSLRPITKNFKDTLPGNDLIV